MERIDLPGGGVAWVKTDSELQEEIELHYEKALLARAAAKSLKASDPDKAALEQIVSKHEQHKASKKEELAKRKTNK